MVCLNVYYTLLSILCLIVNGAWISVGPTSMDTGAFWFQPVGKISTSQILFVDSNVALIATTNGGIWRTSNFSPTQPTTHWTPVTDKLSCSSYTSIAMSKDDKQLIVAGCGSASNWKTASSEWIGPVISFDNGVSFKTVTFPFGNRISGVAVSGTINGVARIVVSVDRAKSGIYQKTIFGAWSTPNVGGIYVAQINNGNLQNINWNNTLSNIGVVKLAQHPKQSNILLGITYSSFNGIGRHIVKSVDGGVTWFASTGYTIQCSTYTSTTPISYGAISYGANDNDVYAVLYFASSSENCYTFLYSNNNGNTWNNINGVNLGTQGNPNTYLTADPKDSTIFYVGGTVSNRFRGKRINDTFVIYTTIGRLQTTLSSPHADSRSGAFYSDTILCETNDGAVSCLTDAQSAGNPTSSAKWSLVANGDLTANEITSISVDPNSGSIVTGAQDNASPFLNAPISKLSWTVIGSGDGQRALIDYSVTPSRVYASAQTGWMWSGRVGGDPNKFVLTNAIVAGETWPFQTNFVLNQANPSVLMTCSDTAKCYNLLVTDNPSGPAFTVSQLMPFSTSMPLTFSPQIYFYGGKLNGQLYQDVIFGITWSNSKQTSLWTRTHIGAEIVTASVQTSIQYPIMYGAQNSENYQHIVLTDYVGNIVMTYDFGKTWSNALSAPLLAATPAIATASPWGVYIMPISSNNIISYNAIIIGTKYGVYVTFDDQKVVKFQSLSDSLPNVFVSSFDYDGLNDSLYIATLGRSVWKLDSAKKIIMSLHDSQ